MDVSYVTVGRELLLRSHHSSSQISLRYYKNGYLDLDHSARQQYPHYYYAPNGSRSF